MPTSRVTALSYAVRPRVVLKYWGQVCIALGAVTVPPLIVSAATSDLEWIRYAIAVGALAVVGGLLTRIHAPDHMQRNEAVVIIALAFLTGPLMMIWPLLGPDSGITTIDGFFEAVSGITTTGLTTVADLESRTPAFLFTRAWMQWYGGLGIVVLAVVLVFQQGILAKQLSQGEFASDDLRGGTRAHFRRVLLVYVLLTAVGIVALFWFGTTPFDALLYSFAAVSTGGFAPSSESLAVLPGSGPVAVTMLLCALGALPLVLYRNAHPKPFQEFFRDPQVRALAILLVAVSAALTASMHFLSGMTWSTAAWDGSVMGASAQTTAGFSITEVHDLSSASKAILIASMFIGGSFGSTAGGIKLMRFLMFLRVAGAALARSSMPESAVLNPRLGKSQLQEAEIREALTLIVLFLGAIFLSWMPFLMAGYDPLDALFEVVSAIGTVGLSTGITSPELPGTLKGILCADMLFGRLEIVAWLILLYPRTWFGRRMEETAAS